MYLSMKESMELFADILLPVAVPRAFTYAVPQDCQSIVVGMRVRVPLGKSKVYEGVVVRVHDTPPGSKTAPKYIIEIIDSQRPFVLLEQMRLWEWMAGYYLCTMGEVLKAAVPLGIRSGGYSPSSELYVRLTEEYRLAERVTQCLDDIRRAKAQCRALLVYLSFVSCDEQGEPMLAPEDGNDLWVLRSHITVTVPSVALLKLVERGVLEQQPIVSSTLGRGAVLESFKCPEIENSSYVSLIDRAFEESNTVLLSGEIGNQRQTTIPIYRDLIGREISIGKQVLLLLPDVVMTVAVTNTLQEVFGSRCLFYHSHLSERARSAAYHRMVEHPDSVSVVVGTRLSLFLPYSRLGLVIVDNEHDSNYRQSDPAPRYHARDSALMLAHLHGARTLLASATPSTESWLNATAEGGKYGLVRVPAQADMEHPRVTVLERGKGLISKYLRQRIGETLEAGRQVVLFQNRRGFAPYVECSSCGATPTCLHCNVTLTYHKERALLQCHYCGVSQPYSSSCMSCGVQALVPRGIGTERIEEYVAELFPDTRIVRMDADTVRGVGASGRILADFADGKTGILVGTQMVARTTQVGERIGLVGVINADNMLMHPDFRAAERAFQLLMQLKALLPRDGDAEMVVQSSQRLHSVLIAVASHDADGFYDREMQERRGLLYPPYVRMLRITFRHPNKPLVVAAAERCEALLRERFGRRVSPPFEPQVDRVQNIHILHLLLRIERERSVARAKEILLGVLAQVRKQFSAVRIISESDPQ